MASSSFTSKQQLDSTLRPVL